MKAYSSLVSYYGIQGEKNKNQQYHFYKPNGNLV